MRRWKMICYIAKWKNVPVAKAEQIYREVKIEELTQQYPVSKKEAEKIYFSNLEDLWRIS